MRYVECSWLILKLVNQKSETDTYVILVMPFGI